MDRTLFSEMSAQRILATPDQTFGDSINSEKRGVARLGGSDFIYWEH